MAELRSELEAMLEGVAPAVLEAVALAVAGEGARTREAVDRAKIDEVLT